MTMNQNELTKKLDHIRELLTHPAIDHTDILRRLQLLLRDINYLRIPYNFEIPLVMRAVCKNSEEWFDNITKLRYPPAENASLGRCNWNNEQVFYSADNNIVPVFEVRAQIGQHIVISAWANKTNQGKIIKIPVRIVGSAIGVENLTKGAEKNPALKFILSKDDIFKNETTIEIKTIDEYIGRLFTESSQNIDNLYWLTSAYSKCLLENLTGERLDGLIYPSVEGKLSGFNFVLTKDFFDSHLKLYGAAMYKVVGFNESKTEYQLQPIKSVDNINDKGNLIWKNVHKNHRNDKLTWSPRNEKQDFDSAKFLPLEDE